jgi:hypothetical protein
MPSDSLQFVDVVLSWSRESPGKTAVLKKEAGGNWEELARVEGTEYTVTGLHPEGTHSFAAAPVLADGGLAPEADWETVQVSPLADEGTPALPEAPTGFAAAQDGATLNLRWDAADDGLVDSYEIREGTSWEDGTLVAEGVTGSPFAWSWWASGGRTLHLKTVDRIGRYSLEAASLSITIEPLGDHADGGTEDQAGLGWPGDQIHLEDDGAGGLRQEAIPPHFGAISAPFGSFASVPAFARYWPEGVYESPPVDVGQVEHQRLEVDLGAAQPVDLNLPFGACRRPALGARRRRDGTYVPLGTRGFASRNSWRATPLVPVDADVEVDTSPTPSGTWDGWRPLAAGTYEFRRVRLRVTVRGDGLRFVRVPRLVITRRKFNRKQEGEVIVNCSPVAVTFPAPFQNAPKVTAHLIGYPGTVEIVSVSPTGFVVKGGAAVFTGDSATFAPNVHWTAMGT